VAAKVTEVTLDAPTQLGFDFVDISVFPVRGSIVYSIKKNNVDVLVEDVTVTAQPVGSTSLIKALPSRKHTSNGGNYSLPLFAGKYLFIAEREGHDIRIDETCTSYNTDTQLVTIETAVSNINFIDHTERKITVFVEDSGGYKIKEYQGNPIEAEINGTNGFATGVLAENEAATYFEATVPPGEYTVSLPNVPDAVVRGGESDGEKKAEVNLTSGDGEVTMVVPVKIELEFVIPSGDTTHKPRLIDAETLEKLGLEEQDNPEGYMYYWPNEPRSHTYIIRATANGNPVEDFTLSVVDEVSMMTIDPPEEQELSVVRNLGADDVDKGKVEYTIYGGLPKRMYDDLPDLPLAAPKNVTFRAKAEGYKESDSLEDNVTVLGDVPVGSAQKVVSIPIVNYTVLHDPPGDGSCSYLDDTVTIKGVVSGLQIKMDGDQEIPVHPLPWSVEREVQDFEFGKDDENPSDKEFKDMEDKGLLEYTDPDNVLGHFTYAALIEAGTGAGIVALGPLGYGLQLLKMGVKAAAIAPVTTTVG